MYYIVYNYSGLCYSVTASYTLNSYNLAVPMLFTITAFSSLLLTKLIPLGSSTSKKKLIKQYFYIIA